jgi:hypothetical protein
MVYHITFKDIERERRQQGLNQEVLSGLPSILADTLGMSVVTNPNVLQTKEYYCGKNGRLTQSVDSEINYFDLAHNLDL